MKKLLLKILFCTSFFSIFAIDNEKFKDNLDNSHHLTELMMDEEYARRQKAISEAERLKREAETELYDGVLGIKYHLANTYELVSDFLRMEFYQKPGTFSIYCMPEGCLDVPLLATNDLSSSTAFFMKLDDRIYNLNSSNRVRRELRRLSDGAQLVYSFDNGVRLIADFSFLKSRESMPADIIRVRLYVLNLGKSSHTVDLKGVFDTVCGEGNSVHFTTEAKRKVRNETRFSYADLKEERTVYSSSDNASFQFVLDGPNVSPVEMVTLANRDEILKMGWDYGFRKGRGFTNIRGYDDSAIMIDWPDFVLPADGKTEFTFYIAASGPDEYPLGITYADGILEIEKSRQDTALLLDFKEPDKNTEVQPNAPESQGENEGKRTDVEFIVPPIKDYQLDSAYIQDLIDKIDKLQSSKDVDKKELKHLNAELDAILEKLRRQ